VSYDLAIVGGGIIGTCIAFSAQRNGFGKTILVDGNGIGRGASDYSAGFDAVESPDINRRQLAIVSRTLYKRISQVVPAAGVQRVQTYWVVNRDRHDTFERNFDLQFHGGEVILQWLQRASPNWKRFEDNFAVAPTEAICFGDSDGYAYPGEISRAIVGWLRESHTQTFHCWEGAQVDSLTECLGGCELSLLDGRKIWARRVVIAVGPWIGAEPFATLGCDVRIKKIASLVIDQPPPTNAAAVVHYERGTFLLPQHKEKKWLFGFTLNVWDVAPNEMRPTLSQCELTEGKNLLESLAPQMAHSIGGSQVFYDAYTKDHNPLVFRPDHFPSVVVVTGTSGAGYRVAPALAEQVLESLS
jgi:D-arginine dehydrogenase